MGMHVFASTNIELRELIVAMHLGQEKKIDLTRMSLLQYYFGYCRRSSTLSRVIILVRGLNGGALMACISAWHILRTYYNMAMHKKPRNQLSTNDPPASWLPILLAFKRVAYIRTKCNGMYIETKTSYLYPCATQCRRKMAQVPVYIGMNGFFYKPNQPRYREPWNTFR
jgi:hypothetical protein